MLWRIVGLNGCFFRSDALASSPASQISFGPGVHRDKTCGFAPSYWHMVEIWLIAV
jgi:hypothetical protein